MMDYEIKREEIIVNSEYIKSVSRNLTSHNHTKKLLKSDSALSIIDNLILTLPLIVEKSDNDLGDR